MKGLDLKIKREKLGLTQSELADLIGKSMRTIITWEKSEELSHSQEIQVNSVFDKYENNSHNETKSVNTAQSSNNDFANSMKNDFSISQEDIKNLIETNKSLSATLENISATLKNLTNQ